jgi:glycosyltransferase involved in cell wall biosynthesis
VRIHYLDPALRRRGGHPFEWCLRSVRALHAQGHVVHVHAHRELEQAAFEAVGAFAEVTPLFSADAFQDPAAADPVSGELTLFLEASRRLAQELRRVRPADLWLWPTLFGHQLGALADAAPGVPVAAVLHWPPQFQAPTLGPAIWRHGSQAARAAGVDLRLAATVEELVPPYQDLLGRSIAVAPAPVDGAPASAPRERLHRIGFFGEQGRRKGADLLPALVRRLLADGHEVLLQDATGRLQAQMGEAPGLQVLGFVDDITAAIAGCDLLVAPYPPERYRAMASGIVWEALSRGVPVVAPAGTAPGRLVEDAGAGRTFERHDADAVHAAIGQVRAQYAGIARAAHAASLRWPAQHGSARFVQTLLSLPQAFAAGA